MRVLVEQSEMWIYKQKSAESTKRSGGGDTKMNPPPSNSSPSSSYASHDNNNAPCGGDGVETALTDNDNEADEDDTTRCAATLRDGPEIDESSRLVYVELFSILRRMTRLCVTETRTKRGLVVQRARKNGQVCSLAYTN